MAYKVCDWREVSRGDFVEHWSRLYRDPREHLYEGAIGRPYTESDVLALFEWKNGGRLSRLKAESVRRNFIDRLLELHELPEDTDPKTFLSRWEKGGAIWRIFWLHCWQPERFPIYDQHVHRAAARIAGWQAPEVPVPDLDRIHTYLNAYLPFCQAEGLFGRSADKALWAFGKLVPMLDPRGEGCAA